MSDLLTAGVVAGFLGIIMATVKIIGDLVKKKKVVASDTKLNGQLAMLNEVLVRLDEHNTTQVRIMNSTSERLIDVCMSQERLATHQSTLADKLSDVSMAVGAIPAAVRQDLTGATERIVAAVQAQR